MKIKNLIIIILAVIAFSFFSGRLSSLGERKSLNRAISSLNEEIKVHVVTISGLEQTSYEKDQIILTKTQAIDLGVLEVDRLKKLGIRKATQVTRIEGQLTAARDSIPTNAQVIHDTVFVDSGNTKNYTQLPVGFKYKDQHLILEAGIDINGLGRFYVNAPVSFVATLGNKRTGVFSSDPIVSITTPSPYLTIQDIQMVNIQKTHWYDPWYVPVAAGAVTGIILWEVARSLLK